MILSNQNKKIKSRGLLAGTAEKAKRFWEQNEREIILAIGVFLALLIAFGSGILVGNNKPKEPLTIEEPAVNETVSSLRENLSALPWRGGSASGGKIFNGSAPEIKNPDGLSAGSADSPRLGGASSEQEKFVASKNGEYYYPLGCAAANRIKDANKIFFSSKEAAERKGLKPSGYCKF